jgi:DNA repair exonuclease SbcCD ATPase subunit
MSGTNAIDAGTTDTGDGFIVGTDPKQPPVDPAAFQDVPQNAVEQSRVQIVGDNQTQRYYTEEDLARVRREEKDKLYKRLEESDNKVSTFEQQLSQLQAERDERAAAEQAARDEAEAARRAEEEAGLNAKQLIERRDQEWSERFSEMESRMDQERAIYEREREWAELMQYRNDVLAQNEGRIVPQLIDLVTGGSREEIDQSVSDLIAKSDAIFEEYKAAAQGQRAAMRGTAATAPPVGPMENESSYQPMTVSDIRDIPMSEWPKYRQQLLQQNAAQRYGG